MKTGFRNALVAAAALILSSQQALADMDASAGYPTGGLDILRADVVDVQSLDLKLSLRAIEADYQIANPGSETITTLVSFALPDIDGGYFEYDGPQGSDGNLVGAQIAVDGKAIQPRGCSSARFWPGSTAPASCNP